MTKEDWSAICSILTMVDSAMRAPHSGFRDERMQNALKIARDKYEALAALTPSALSGDTRLAHSLPSQADAGERSKIVAWLRSIDEGPLKGWQPNALANAIERGDYFRLADESLAVDQLQAMGQDFDATSGEEMRLREAWISDAVDTACDGENGKTNGFDWEARWQRSKVRAALTKGVE